MHYQSARASPNSQKRYLRVLHTQKSSGQLSKWQPSPPKKITRCNKGEFVRLTHRPRIAPHFPECRTPRIPSFLFLRMAAGIRMDDLCLAMWVVLGLCVFGRGFSHSEAHVMRTSLVGGGGHFESPPFCHSVDYIPFSCLMAKRQVIWLYSSNRSSAWRLSTRIVCNHE